MYAIRKKASESAEWDAKQVATAAPKRASTISIVEVAHADGVAGRQPDQQPLPALSSKSRVMEIPLGRNTTNSPLGTGCLFSRGEMLLHAEKPASPVPATIILNRVYKKPAVRESFLSILDSPPSPARLPFPRYLPSFVGASSDDKREDVALPKTSALDNGGECKYTLTPTGHTLSERDGNVIEVQCESSDIVPSMIRNSPDASVDSASHTPNRSLSPHSLSDLPIIVVGRTEEPMEYSDEEVVECVDESVHDDHSAGMLDTRNKDETGKSEAAASYDDSDNDSTKAGAFKCISNTASSADGNVSTFGTRMQPTAASIGQPNEFDLMLEKIKESEPAMSQQDRIDQWRVTKEDLLHSIPTKAEIETSSSLKRPLDKFLHISGEDSDDSASSVDSPGLLPAKKRCQGVESNAAHFSSVPSLDDGLDFRRSQINPEIDKVPPSMILERRNYHKLLQRRRAPSPCPSSGTADAPNRSQIVADGTALLSDRDVAEDKLPGLEERSNAVTGDAMETNAIVVVTSDTKASPGLRYCKNSGKPATTNTVKYKVRKPVSGTKNDSPKKLKPKKKLTHVNTGGLRCVRRVMFCSSLRNGKIIRNRATFAGLVVKSKAKPKQLNTVRKAPPAAIRRSPAAQPALDSEPECSTMKTQPTVCQNKSRRSSVDSAVSSSTSAEMGTDKQPKKVEPKQESVTGVSNDLKRMRNPITRTYGEVLYASFVDGQLVLVQRDLVSFWKYSKLAALLGVKQEWQKIGQVKRIAADSEIDPHSSDRLGQSDGTVIYLEPRARNLNEDKTRACPLASIYVNSYFADAAPDEDKDGEIVVQKSYQLEVVNSKIEDIHFLTLPASRSFIVCWHDQIKQTESRTGICKYGLAADLETFENTFEFPTVAQRLLKLKCLADGILLGLGDTTVVMWNYENGFLIGTFDLKMTLGLTVCGFIHTEVDERSLFLVQIQPSKTGCINRKELRVIAVNMQHESWHVVHSYEIALTSMSIAGEMVASDGSAVHCTTFQSGEMLVLSLHDFAISFTNHHRVEKDLQRTTESSIMCSRARNSGDPRPRERILLTSDTNCQQLIFLSEQYLTLKTVDEYMLECR